MAVSKKTMVALGVMVAALALLASSASAAITCGQVGTSLAPCIPYATGKASTMAPGCCTGVRSLNSQARTSSDRQAACRCLKSLANSVKSVNMGTVATIPGKCGVNVGFPISMSTDCNKDEKKLVESIKFANACGAITATKKGAIPSLPTEAEVLQLIEKA